MTARGLSAEEEARTQRQQILPELGATGQRALSGSRVVVVGAGGLGSPVITYLAAAGVGHLTVIDDDVVDVSNLHRQFLHRVEAVGQPKTASAVAVAQGIAPECEVVELRQRLTDANATKLLAGFDVIVDGSDSFDTRFAINTAATELGLPIVWGAVLAWSSQVCVLWPTPPATSSISPLSLTDVFADTPATRNTVSCSTAGVMGAVCGQAGSVMALEVIKLLTGIGTPLLGRMMVFDGLRSESRMIDLASPQAATELPLEPRPLSELPAEAIVVDVRFESEVSTHPGPVSAIHLPLEKVLQLTAASSSDSLAAASASTPIVTLCAEGPRSIRAARHLLAQGYPVAGFLDGGWR